MGHKFHSGFGLGWTNLTDTIMSLLEVNCVKVGGFSTPDSGLIVSTHVEKHREEEHTVAKWWSKQRTDNEASSFKQKN